MTRPNLDARSKGIVMNQKNTAFVLLMTLPGIVCAATAPAPANAYVQHNLVADLPGVADVTDPNLVNPWGISESATSPFWISDNHSGLTTLYNGAGAITPLVVTVAAPAGRFTVIANGSGIQQHEGVPADEWETRIVYLRHRRWNHFGMERRNCLHHRGGQVRERRSLQRDRAGRQRGGSSALRGELQRGHSGCIRRQVRGGFNRLAGSRTPLSRPVSRRSTSPISMESCT